MTRIIARHKPCTCGCRGQDPWHARTFDRVIRDVKDLFVEPIVDGNIIREIYREGVVTLPWGDERVVECGVGLVDSTNRTKWWEIRSNT